MLLLLLLGDEIYDTQLFEVITLLFNKLLKTDHEPHCSITAMDKATLLYSLWLQDCVCEAKYNTLNVD